VPFIYDRAFDYAQEIEVQNQLPSSLILDCILAEEEEHTKNVQAERDKKQKIKEENEQKEREKQEAKEQRRIAREEKKRKEELQRLKEEIKTNFIDKG